MSEGRGDGVRPVVLVTGARSGAWVTGQLLMSNDLLMDVV
jgi:hypothetical protein